MSRISPTHGRHTRASRVSDSYTLILSVLDPFRCFTALLTLVIAPACSVLPEQPAQDFDCLVEEGVPRGLNLPPLDPEKHHPSASFLTPLAASDLDGDGDIDLVVGRPDSALDLYENDGNGVFLAQSGLLPPDPGGSVGAYFEVAGHFFADLDGDSLPDLLRPGFGLLAMHRNLGNLSFGGPEFLYLEAESSEPAFYGTVAVADLDIDGDLDIILPSLHGGVDSSHEGLLPGAPDLILMQRESGSFEVAAELLVDGLAGMSQLALPTDRDGDGDLDIYVGADLKNPLYPPAAFWRNDGSTSGLVEDAAVVGTDQRVSAMGAAVFDYNEDGLPDYCFSDIGPIACLLSNPDGPYVEMTATWNLEPSSLSGTEVWTAWSIEAVDIDNDGRLDLISSGGAPDDIEGEKGLNNPFDYEHPNAIWQGTRDGFIDRTGLLNFGNLGNDYGLAAADFNEDGFVDVAVAGHDGVRLWVNQCSVGAWLQLDLIGGGLNRQAFGASVRVEAGERSWFQEVTGPRTVGQSPTRLHFGLGEIELIERVTVQWLGGANTVLENVDVRQILRVEQ